MPHSIELLHKIIDDSDIEYIDPDPGKAALHAAIDELVTLRAMAQTLSSVPEDDIRDYEQGICCLCDASNKQPHKDSCPWKMARENAALE